MEAHDRQRARSDGFCTGRSGGRGRLGRMPWSPAPRRGGRAGSGSAGRSWTTMLALTVTLCLLPLQAWAAEKLIVAVAANFINPFKEIVQLYAEGNGVAVEPTFGASGALYHQIVNGAPYDLLLSADVERPDLLFQKGLAEKPAVYARGKVILWVNAAAACGSGNWKEVVRLPQTKRIAIANMETAPYGHSAREAMVRTGLWETAKERLVIAQSVAQSFQYAATGSVDAAFCALSAAKVEPRPKGCFFLVEEAPPVVQAACVLPRSPKREEARKFLQFLLSEQTLGIRQRYGYE